MNDEWELVTRLRDGDQAAFVELVDRYHPSLLRIASTFVGDEAVAEVSVQQTWLGVVRGMGRFEGRSSLRSWLFTIVVNRARAAGSNEARAWSEPSEMAAVDASRFGPDGSWSSPPVPWVEQEHRLIERETIERVVANLDVLSAGQRQVVVLRDMEGFTAGEVSRILGISDGDQRLLLHRARSRMRQLIEDDLGKV